MVQSLVLRADWKFFLALAIAYILVCLAHLLANYYLQYTNAENTIISIMSNE